MCNCVKTNEKEKNVLEGCCLSMGVIVPLLYSWKEIRLLAHLFFFLEGEEVVICLINQTNNILHVIMLNPFILKE